VRRSLRTPHPAEVTFVGRGRRRVALVPHASRMPLLPASAGSDTSATSATANYGFVHDAEGGDAGRARPTPPGREASALPGPRILGGVSSLAESVAELGFLLVREDRVDELAVQPGLLDRGEHLVLDGVAGHHEQR
jgi:hypothetical protein